MAEEKKKVNTTKSVNKTSTDAQLKQQIERFKKKIGNEKEVDFAIPEAFTKAFGPNLFVGVNGVRVNIPIDGKKRPFPETLVKHAERTLNNTRL